MKKRYAWHKFSTYYGSAPLTSSDTPVGAEADCGFVVDEEWVNAPREIPTIENTCPSCLQG